MKLNIDKKYIISGFTALFVALLAILFDFLLNKYESIFSFVVTIWRIISPIIYGCVIAFLLDPVINWFEKSFLPMFDKSLLKVKAIPIKKRRVIRAISVIISYFIFIVLLICFFVAVIPQITESIEEIIASSSTYKENVEKWVRNILVKNPKASNYVIDFYNNYSSMFEEYFKSKILPWLNSIVYNMGASIKTVFTTLWNIIVGFIVSIYILLNKETFKGQFKKICFGIFNIKTGNSLIKNTRFVKEKFSGFIVGKIIDSAIIGIICYICCLIFKFDYPLLLALIIGVTNIIPVFGPFIGAVPCALLLLLISPIKCLYFIIFIIVLQMLDGNIIGPKILGSSTGISSFWVIFAITLFGGLWGVPGMIIGVPLFAVLYALLKTIVENGLNKKAITVDTNKYVYLDYIQPETMEFVECDDLGISASTTKKKEKKINFFNKPLQLFKKDRKKDDSSQK